MNWDPNDGERKSQEDKMIKRLDRAREQKKKEEQSRTISSNAPSKTKHNLIPDKTMVLAFDFISYERDQDRAANNGKKFNDSRNKYYRRGLVKEIYSRNKMDFVKIEFDHRKGFISDGHLLADIRETT